MPAAGWHNDAMSMKRFFLALAVAVAAALALVDPYAEAGRIAFNSALYLAPL